ncbi:MAG TPA: hypothetical protein VKQ73_16645 [Stellaceae bacterium]|nr:hypothetical protein [Stellaceae bacterium]
MYPEGQHLLLIDNDAERRQLCEEILLDAGFAVTAVADSISAIRAASSCRFALAVIAMVLPGTLDGPATIRRIRAAQPLLKALFTGTVVQRPFLRGRDRDEFIPSPFRRRDFLGCVFELLHREVAPLSEAWSERRAG